jgi:hypothetical protein
MRLALVTRVPVVISLSRRMLLSLLAQPDGSPPGSSIAIETSAIVRPLWW